VRRTPDQRARLDAAQQNRVPSSRLSLARARRPRHQLGRVPSEGLEPALSLLQELTSKVGPWLIGEAVEKHGSFALR
jgi:hypothetical protein